MGPSEDVKDEFLNSYGEVHAAWFGFCEAIGAGAHITLLPEGEVRSLIEEIHYCLLGVVAAGVTLAGLVAIAAGSLTGLMFGPGSGLLVGALGFSGYLLVWAKAVLPGIREEMETDLRVTLARYDAHTGRLPSIDEVNAYTLSLAGDDR